MIFGTFLRSGSKGVPGWSQGHSKGPSRVKIAPKWVSKWLKHINKCCPKAFWKRFSKTCDLSMFPNSSWRFFSFFLLMQRKILCHICPSKVPTLIHLARGENLRWMPPRCLPDAFQMSPQMPHGSQMLPRCLPRCLMPPRCLRDASQLFLRYQMFLRCLQVVSKMPLKCPFRKHCLGSRAGVILTYMGDRRL